MQRKKAENKTNMDEDPLTNVRIHTIHHGRIDARPLIECLDIQSTFEKQKKSRLFHRNESTRSINDQIDSSPGKIEVGRSTIDICEPIPEHLHALRNAFNKILNERLLSESSFKLRHCVFNKLRQLILSKRSDCRINLYGSMLFECCLEKPGTMDIDVQFKQALQYDTLKELLEIITSSDLCKEARINTDHKPSCIDLALNEVNIRVRVTSGYNRGINLSKLIRIYTRFDSRVIKLLRLFRILSKTCNIDKPDLGTLHPVVFHIMVIHFLQQLDPPILPCLHEYVFGIDHVPITMNENRYPEFFRVSNEYSRQWKSKNTTEIELLFLQLLSYYVKTFNTKQFVISIQTRMPVVKIDKNWHSKKLLVEDPSDVKRSLCQTMQAIRSINYFRDTLNTALNYFGRKQKKIKKVQVTQTSNENTNNNDDDDFIEIIAEDENEIPIIEPTNALHNSYNLFYKRLPLTIVRDVNIRQSRVRDYYKKTFEAKLPEPIIKSDSLLDQQFENSTENEIEEAFQHDLEHDFETMDAYDDEQNILLDRTVSNNDYDESLNIDFDELNIENDMGQKQSAVRKLFAPTNDEEKSNETNPSSLIIADNEQDNIVNNQVIEVYEKLKPSFEDKSEIINVDTPSIESNMSAIQNDVNKNSLASTNNDDPSVFTSPIKDDQLPCIDNPSSDLFYDFQAENFHAEQGAPFVCTICNNVGHLKSECPELIVPNMVDLPEISEEWIQILSSLCQYITEQCKPRHNDIENRERILIQLQKQFEKDYPDCSLHAFGSFYNGFGFRKSDLDVCIVFKDQREEHTDEALQIMKRILKSMRSSSDTFESVQPILHAKVPIIRSKHRRLQIEIDISFHNMLAIENTRLLKAYADIDPRVSQLGYMIKHLAKSCDIGDASRGTLSSYAYIIMVIHFLQQIKPSVLPVLQQLSDNQTTKDSMYKKCSKWNVYFYDNLHEINNLWKNENKLSVGKLWIEFLRFYTEQFNYDEHVVTIRQFEPLLKYEKGWFRQTIAVEDPFELNHNLAGGLSIRNWTLIRRVLIRARQQFGLQSKDIDISTPDLQSVESILFNINDLCLTNAPRRCAECKEPYHIRKRCPKLISLISEKEKLKRVIIPEQQQQKQQQHHQQQTLINHQYDLYSISSDNNNNNRFQTYPQYYYSANGYQYPIQVASNQRVWTQPYSNHRPIIHSNFSYQSNYQQQSANNSNRPFYSNSQRRKCFICGSSNHLKAQCSQFHSNTLQR
ncbi:unnamed protein product [Rotaria socialis]|uniref:CCHC-type domain-containing protein n=2 Tax=Rotaria socialis TaxID=392032 RepID=A0A817T4Z5_9BILA|nr:unnamed protein product [Rotaria socialis]CAF3309026.1 unnamed protein product [Rotaria socialis]CAF3425670.1 unnamed protein product [Rotaria socialis]